MFLRDENFDLVSATEYKSEVFADIENVPVPTEQEIEEMLAEAYISSSNEMATKLGIGDIATISQADTQMIAGSAGFIDFGKKVWEWIRKHLCKILNTDSTAGAIIDAVIEAVLSLIPGGALARRVIKVITKYVLNMGYQRLCPIN